MLRIALVSEQISPLTSTASVRSGSRALYLAQIARRLAECGHHVDVYTRCDAPHLPPSIEWAPNLRVIHVPAGEPRRLAAEEREAAAQDFNDFLRREWPARRYDVAHATCVASGLVARAAAQAADLPLLVTYRGAQRLLQREGEPPLLAQQQRIALEAEMLRQATRVLVLCEADRRRLCTRMGLDVERVDVVPCGYDPQDLSPMTRAHARHTLGWDAERYTLLQLGRFAPRQGTDNLIRALARLRDHHRVDAMLYVVGGREGTPEFLRLHELAAACGVADQVVLLGRCGRESLSYLYHAADVFVTTPRSARSGMAPIEAMACGIPVVGCAVGSLASVVVDGVTGQRVPPNNPMALAAALARLAERPGLRHAYGRAARRQVRTGYNWRQITRELFASYRRAMAAGQGAQALQPTETVPALQAVS